MSVEWRENVLERGLIAMVEKTQQYRVTNLVGTPTDYSKESNWAHLPDAPDQDVDVFFVYPTVYMNPAPDAPTIVGVEDATHRAAVQAHYPEAPLVFEGLANVYEPYYRQTNICAFDGKDFEETIEFQSGVQRTDLYAALDYFFAHYNHGRPFMLAGHSQGSMMLKIALTDYFKEHTDLLERMVAAYIIGFAFTVDDLAANPALMFAEAADDTGVVVSWNTEGPENKYEHNACVQPGAISINPLNWKRDETYAPASQNLGDRLTITDGVHPTAIAFEEHCPGLADAQIDLERGVVVTTTISDRYLKPAVPGAESLFGPASLHTSDYPAFWGNIRENVRVRTQAYLSRA